MLSERDKRQFVRRGYVVKQLDFDPALIARTIDLAWEHMDPRMVRDDPATWQGEVTDSCHTRPLYEREGRVKLRQCVQRIRWLADIIQADPRILAMVRDLIGPDAVPRRTIRGLYPVFPVLEKAPRSRGGMDAHPFQVSCILYLNDVEPGGGEFMVWEGSHKIMCDSFDGPYTWTLNDQLRPLKKRAERECELVGLPGRTGTVILWHHRLLHGPQTNHRAVVRHALVGDFLRGDWEARAGERHADVGMWSGWAIDDNTARLRPWAALRRWLGGGDSTQPV